MAIVDALFDNFFNSTVSPDVTPEERKKAEALVRVIAKSTASLSDVLALADALEIQLSFYAQPKRTVTPETTPEV